MRFQKGIGYPRSEWRRPRGPGRKRYHMSEAAWRARRRNLASARGSGKIKLWRCFSETGIVKLLIWQAYFDENPPTERALARQLGVRPSYVNKVKQRATSKGLDALTRFGRRVTLDDLAKEQHMTARIRERDPHLFADPQATPPTKSCALPTPAAAPKPEALPDKVCVCPTCEKPRDLKSPSGYTYSWWERCCCPTPTTAKSVSALHEELEEWLERHRRAWPHIPDPR